MTRYKCANLIVQLDVAERLRLSSSEHLRHNRAPVQRLGPRHGVWLGPWQAEARWLLSVHSRLARGAARRRAGRRTCRCHGDISRPPLAPRGSDLPVRVQPTCDGRTAGHLSALGDWQPGWWTDVHVRSTASRAVSATFPSPNLHPSRTIARPNRHPILVKLRQDRVCSVYAAAFLGDLPSAAYESEKKKISRKKKAYATLNVQCCCCRYTRAHLVITLVYLLFSFVQMCFA